MQFSIRKILYCNRAHSFYQTKARLIAVSFKTIRRLKSSLALRHRLTTVLPTSIQLLLRKIYKRFMPLLLFWYYYTRRKTPCQVFFKIFFANCGFLRRIVVFFTAHAFEKPTKCEMQQTATIATISANAPSEPKITTIFSRHFSLYAASLFQTCL